MIYATIDTNAWIYLANGHGLDKEKDDKTPHIRMLNALKDCVDSGLLTLLSNDIIIEEWNRNKKNASSYIEKLYNKKTDAEHRLKKTIKAGGVDAATIRAEISDIEARIAHNELHLNNVEDMLLNHTIKCPISDQVYIDSAKQALKKLAPFKGRKSNSMADMVILLSGIEYIKKNCNVIPDFFPDNLHIYATNYFVSNNKEDFSSSKDENMIHEDLKDYLDETGTQYCRNLGALLNEVSQITLFDETDLQDYDDYTGYDSELIDCPICCDPNLGFIDFSNKIKIRNEKYPLFDERQLRFSFDTRTIEELNRKAYSETMEGYCENCCSHFIICTECDSIVSIDYHSEEDSICDDCGAIYRIIVRQDKKGNIEHIDYILLKNEEGEEENVSEEENWN